MKITKENTVKEIICHTIEYNGEPKPFHWHENIEICRVVNNKGSFRVDGTTIDADAGDILVIGEQVVHQFLIEEKDTAVRICQLSPKAIMDRSVNVRGIKPHIKASEIQAVPNLKQRLDSMFDIIETDGGADRVEDKPYLKSVAASVYYMLMHYFPENSDRKNGKDRQLFYNITDYVNKHFAEDISVGTIAENLYVSRGKAGSVFLRYSGETLTQYINSIRVKNANMLMDSGCTITQAALDSGFQNVRTFNEVYKKIMKITPREYITR